MHKAVLAPLVFIALALAGCSGDDHKAAKDFTCPNGAVIQGEDIEAVEGHHGGDFDPATLCPIPPTVTLSGLPASVQVYLKAPFSWSIDVGSVEHGHSMLTSIRYSATSVPDADASLTTYAKEIIKKEHQDLPVTFKGNMTFNVPGQVYVRAYAQVQGDKFPRIDVWSQELVLNVTPIEPTGTIHTTTHVLGPVGDLEPKTIDAVLGDALQFTNDDLLENSLELTSAPPGSAQCEPLAAGRMATSTLTCLFLAPGTYTFATTEDPTPKTMSVTVPQP